ncbi:hypothetical protein FEP52_01479 [Burkholderia multivorans]|nr:hypothetical protein [Burkholderia multivorans]
MPVYWPSAVVVPITLLVVVSASLPVGTRTATISGDVCAAIASSERASVPFVPALLIAVCTSVMRTGRFSGKVAASASSAVLTRPMTAVLTVRMGRVPSLISMTRTPWW